MAGASYDTVLAEYKAAINAAMAKFFDSTVEQINLAELSPESKHSLAILQEFTTRDGKRIRGALAAWAYDQVNGTHLAEPGLELAVAIELVQNYLLIVDDVMDRSDIRRGKPSIHQVFMREKALGGDEHTANMLAINVGLLALHLSSWLLAQINEQPDRVAKSSAIMQKNISATVYGQIDDLYQHVSRDVGEADILRTYYFKNSTYTFINPLQLGLALAGKYKDDELSSIDAFGSAAGIAFQIRDDYLGVFGDPEVTGKSNLDDIKEGKQTLMINYALNHADADAVKRLKGYLGKADFSAADLEDAKQILRESGAEAFALERIKFYAKQAIESVDSNQIWSDDAKQFLKQLVDFVSERNK